MSPCIKLYNNYCSGNENATVIWNRLENELEIEKFLCYDAESLKNIALLILRNVKNGAELIPIEEHQEIINKLSCLTECEKIDLVNVDFHHDIWYNPDSLENLINFDDYSCADWVGYLYFKNKLNSYKWVKAANSDMFKNSTAEKIPLEILGKRDLVTLESDFDKIFFCFSPQWTPYKYRHLYELIIEMCKGESV
jgi:hypothetical protein